MVISATKLVSDDRLINQEEGRDQTEGAMMACLQNKMIIVLVDISKKHVSDVTISKKHHINVHSKCILYIHIE